MVNTYKKIARSNLWVQIKYAKSLPQENTKEIGIMNKTGTT